MDVQTVSQLTRSIKGHLNQQFPATWVAGEISGLVQPASGHLYFTLKDAHAQLNAIIWNSDVQNLAFQPTDGMKVICRGGVDVYPQRGSYQLIVRKIQPQGVGALELALRQLRKKLADEGLFDPQHKRPLPALPKHVAVVTSPAGAAIRDFLQVLLRRWKQIRVTIVPARVQGPGAASEVAAAIRRCGKFSNVPDVIVVTRGGGSIEDLWTFNEEEVVRAIFESEVPVMTGIGHEIDVTLSDLVSDVRALTPSEAAERLVPSMDGLRQWLHTLAERLRIQMLHRLSVARSELESIASHPALTRPLARCRQLAMEVDQHEHQLHQAMRQMTATHHRDIVLLASRLEAMSPLKVLARGYSVTTNDQGRPLTDCRKIEVGDKILTRLANGSLHSTVEEILGNESS